MVLGIVLIGPTLPWMLETPNAENAHLRRAGEWIREHGGDTPRILTTRHRVAFYANGIHLPSPREADPDLILRWAHDENPGWLVFDQHRMLRESPSFFDDLEAAAGRTLKRVYMDPPSDRGGTRRVIVYRYHPPP
jgi:hypothetical protein